MLRVLYIILSVVTAVMLLVIYFQNIGMPGQFQFFKGYVWVNSLMFSLIIISLLLGVFITLAFTNFLSGSRDVTDEFDL